KNRISIKVSMAITSLCAIKKLVESGLGLGVVSEYIARDEIETSRLKAIPVADDCLQRSFYMVHHKEKYMSESLQRFMNKVYQWASTYEAPVIGTDAAEISR
ncbi:MAG: hypothetical protein JRI77_03210, partial [Deltaproteobacteria bacterium]|nr:hypothetical protein [Deltaproteobacteria bacterium]